MPITASAICHRGRHGRVLNAYSHTMKAAKNAGCADSTQKRIRDLVARESFGERFVIEVLGRRLALS